MSLPLDAEPDRIRAAEARVAFLSAAVEACDAAVVSVDNGALVTSWNHTAQRLFGYGAGDALGQPGWSVQAAEGESTFDVRDFGMEPPRISC